MRVEEIQKLLFDQQIDGWLLYDFRRTNPIAYRTLGLSDELIATRRWYYFIPATGEPAGLVSALEAANLDALPGRKHVYRTWEERRDLLRSIVPGGSTIAMEYSPFNAIPYVSTVDGGTLELVRSLGVNVVSSADLVQHTVARWNQRKWTSHTVASAKLISIKDEAFAEVRRCIREGISLTDYQLQQFMFERYAREGLIADDPPIVATNAHCSNPHFLPTHTHQTIIRDGDVLLVDFWAKLREPSAVYADYTWMGFVGEAVPLLLANVFAVVAGARDAAIEFVTESLSAGATLHGWEVDDAARNHVRRHGYGEYFIHRTGHNIDEEVHGEGANMDNFETHDERIVMEQTCFSIEPGIYLADFGVRSEVDVFIADAQHVIVTGTPIQRSVVPLLA